MIIKNNISLKDLNTFGMSVVARKFVTIKSKKDLITVFWISEHYNPEDPDVFFEKV